MLLHVGRVWEDGVLSEALDSLYFFVVAVGEWRLSFWRSVFFWVEFIFDHFVHLVLVGFLSVDDSSLEDWGLDWFFSRGWGGSPLFILGIVSCSFLLSSSNFSSFFVKCSFGGSSCLIFGVFSILGIVFLSDFFDGVIVVSNSFLSNSSVSNNSISGVFRITKWDWLGISFLLCWLWDSFWCVGGINFGSSFVNGFLSIIISSLKSFSNDGLLFCFWLLWLGSFFSGTIILFDINCLSWSSTISWCGIFSIS